MSEICEECGFETCYECSYKTHDHFLCENCGDKCDNCKEWFCSARNRRYNMEVCDDCMMWNG